ncbi:hypothetical protein BX666DRAFT_1615454 [Dichotomocladium elegans]|nr:hypothetical protein BX666DRAFT_1615454 [Dichotomocladium elegans]
MLSRQIASTTAKTMTARRLFGTSTVARNDGYSKPLDEKEKAQENQWAHQHDAEKLKALRKALEEQEKVTAQLKQELETLSKSKK